MTREDAIEILKYKVRMFDTDVYIGDLDKGNIEAIKILLDYIEELKEQNRELREKKKSLEKIGEHFSLHYIKTNIDDYTQDEIDRTINNIYDKINEIIDYIKSEEE